ncbi:MAG: endonuclease III [Actinomycetota bacterium]|nr:endonuclease III [Actinomycetota bacterium]
MSLAYPPSHPLRPSGPSLDPLSELIFTVLSQNTSDVNRDRAWAGLRRTFPTWPLVLDASSAALVRTIAPGGLANTKAPRIQAILRVVLEREGRLSLARLRRLSDDEASAYLLSLPGIGPKTATCVLAFSLDRSRLPVDTHVQRVAVRLALAAPRSKPADTQTALEGLVPPSARVDAHVSLIAHGRGVCRAQRPLCGSCVLLDVCPSGWRFLKAGPAGG